MHKAQLNHIANDHYRELRKQLKKVAAGFDEKAIHQFRVACKKLRAFLRMVSFQNKERNEIKISKNLKQVYQLCGIIRDLQLHQQRVKEAIAPSSQKPIAYFDLLNKEIENIYPGLYWIYLKDPVKKSKEKSASLMPAKFTTVSFKNFIQQKWTNVFAITGSGNFTDDNIHTVRKMLKYIVYGLKIFDSHGRRKKIAQIAWKEKSEEYFITILTELGNFQDKCTALLLLQKHSGTGLNKGSRTTLEQVRKNWLKEKASMKKMLVEKLKKEISILDDTKNKPFK